MFEPVANPILFKYATCNLSTSDGLRSLSGEALRLELWDFRKELSRKSWSRDRSVAWSLHRSVTQLLDRSFDRSIAHLTVDCSIARSPAPSLDRSAARSLDRLISRSRDAPTQIGHYLDDLRWIWRLSGNFVRGHLSSLGFLNWNVVEHIPKHGLEIFITIWGYRTSCKISCCS